MAKKEYERYNRIKVIMVDKNIEPITLAEKVGLSVQTVNRFCRNETQPSIKKLREIAMALNVDVRELLVSTEVK